MVPATQMIENVVGVIRQNASKSPLMVKDDNCYLKLLSKVSDMISELQNLGGTFALCKGIQWCPGEQKYGKCDRSKAQVAGTTEGSAPHRGKRAANRTVNDALYFFRMNKKTEISFWHHKSVAYRLTTNLKILDDQSGWQFAQCVQCLIISVCDFLQEFFAVSLF